MAAARAVVATRIRAYAGLDPPGWLLDARLQDRAAVLGLTVDAYLKLASGDDARAGHELEALSEMLRVGETRFFRHRAQVEALRTRVLPERVRAAQLAGRQLRVWSAGCATGEEAWTLALLCDETRADFEVHATDLSEDALERARRARYEPERVADVPDGLRGGFDGQGHIVERLRERVVFQRHNLLQPRYPERFDLVLCRNVMIYFDAQTRADVIEKLGHALLPGGYLFLGYSETVRDHVELFDVVRDADECVMWRRRDEMVSQRRALAQLPPEPVPEPRAAEEVTQPDAPRVELRGDYHDAERLASELKPVIAAQRAVVDLDGAEFLGDDAARVLARAIMAAPGLQLTASRPAVRRWLERHGLTRVHR